MFGYFGNIFSKFRRKKTVVEVLENLDEEIKEYEEFKQKSQSNERKFVGALVLYSILMYIFGAIIYYFYLMPNNLVDFTKSLLPFFITPIILYFTRKFLKWFYIKRVVHYDSKLSELKREKKKIIEEVKEKETYKKAREILERFSGEEVLKQEQQQTGANNANNMPTSTPLPQQRHQSQIQQAFQQQQQQQQQQQMHKLNATVNGANLQTPMNQIQKQRQIQSAFIKPNEQQFINNNQNMQPKMPMYGQMARPILSQDRSVFDKVVDAFIGDGPNNRYALICQRCYSHNGMALKEEFEYISYRCAYCLQFNEARKKKLNVPDLKTLYDTTMINQTILDSDAKSSSDEEKQPKDTSDDDKENNKAVVAVQDQEKRRNSIKEIPVEDDGTTASHKKID